MIKGLRRVPVCVWLAVFALLSPAISWAETSQQAVTLGRETELIATRTLAFASTEDPGPVEKGGIPTLHPEEGFQSGTWHLGALAGYSTPQNIPQRETGGPNVHFAPLFLQVGYTVTDVHGPIPVRGSVEIMFEPTFLITSTPKKVFGEGASLLARYNFVTRTRWVPFFSLGIGILYWNLRVMEPRTLGTKFNFTLQAGTGLHYFVTDNLAVTGEVRLHHVSNAGRETPNIGINSTVYVLGASYFF